MRTDLRGYDIPPNITTYPHLRISNKQCVVLFTENRAGVVLVEGEQTAYKVGQFVSGLYENSYTALRPDADVVLSNKGLM